MAFLSTITQLRSVSPIAWRLAQISLTRFQGWQRWHATVPIKDIGLLQVARNTSINAGLEAAENAF